jgi:hypothetical protein
VALPDRVVGDRARFERGQRLGALAVERDFDERRQAVAERICGEEGNPALDDSGANQRFDPSKCGLAGRDPDWSATRRSGGGRES